MNRFFIVLSLILLSGCSALRTSRFEPSPPAATESTVSSPAVAPDRMALLSMLDGILRSEAADWNGTPHVLGGISTAGIDCSGLIQRIYADALGVHLPRTTELQQREGQKVRRNDLVAGDLVFFTPDGKGKHAGIVMSGGDFVHASSSRGVMTSNLSNPYWRKHFKTGRRILDDDSIMELIELADSGN